jgi:UDP-3-O-[3-hydroxymyristoyl] glucosamine N-acyltransferase
MTYTLSELADLTGAKLQGDPELAITDVADLASATESDASFLANAKYTPLLSKTKAGVICISEEQERNSEQNYLISPEPSRTFQKIAEALQAQRKSSSFTGIHETAVIHPSTEIGEDVTIGPYVVIDQDVQIGRGTVIAPHVTLYPGVQVGEDCHLHAKATVREYCSLGNRVTLQPGAVIGSCGFGYTTNERGEHSKLEQLGNVILEDDVEIGANTTIDRARFKTTRIGKGTKIDNLVQIAHNVELGEHNILAAQTGIAGTTKTGRNVMMGGQVGVVGHLEIGDFVMKTIHEKGRYAGSPVVPLAQHNKTQVHKRKLETYARRIEALEKQIADLLKTTV